MLWCRWCLVFSKALEPATRKMSTTTRVTRVNCTVQNFTIGSYKSQSLKICFISTKASAKRLVDIHRPNGAFGPLKYWLNPGTLLLQILSLIQWVKLPCPTPIAILCMSSKEAGYREDSREHAGGKPDTFFNSQESGQRSPPHPAEV